MTVATAHTAPAPAPCRIGPNAVLQTLAALEARQGPAAALEVRARAGVPDTFPPAMVPEDWFVATIEAVRARSSAAEAEAILAEAGRRTADYVAAHRIPGLAKAALRMMPARFAQRALLAAIERHAWTFAGRGAFRVEDGALTLTDSPTCRRPLAVAGGAYYAAAFEGLLALAGRWTVREVACAALGAPRCRFEIAAPTDQGVEPCASY